MITRSFYEEVTHWPGTAVAGSPSPRIVAISKSIFVQGVGIGEHRGSRIVGFKQPLTVFDVDGGPVICQWASR